MTNDELPRQKFDCLDKIKAMAWHLLAFPSTFHNPLHNIKAMHLTYFGLNMVNSTNKKF